jgi:hypothetical protein
MDVGNHGGSAWVVDPNLRLYGSYNYRAASYYTAGYGDLRLGKLGSNFLLYVDTPDLRFRGERGVYVHKEGYSRGFVDGSSRFLFDPTFEIDRKIIEQVGPSGIMHGIDANAPREEVVYEQMSHEQEP